ncbi:hypothetical protein D3C84_1275800 [compost metagenome]
MVHARYQEHSGEIGGAGAVALLQALVVGQGVLGGKHRVADAVVQDQLAFACQEDGQFRVVSFHEIQG